MAEPIPIERRKTVRKDEEFDELRERLETSKTGVTEAVEGLREGVKKFAVIVNSKKEACE